ncbi:gamma-glutamyl-gamma-aminobutyrate hydrolase family protein [Thermoflexus sp.]|uniref:gamma-glutamyl-gamma-aminobutyrate hydrolase family protein n=1 Tax=Thermoflexus sp. TaxID=1969742 RepID=UPI002ADE4C1E|nr:gamma-glutamyl-gamma-aminobutyrate hydrolase family protein [Thermoflexus sp.]
MRRPLIGVTVKNTRERASLKRAWSATETAYLRAIWRAGGLPVMLPNLPPEAAAMIVERVDGVLLTGGGDIDPARYGASRHPETAEVDPDRDAFEFALLEAARDRGRPILGICRGFQVMAVAWGGILCQHLPDITELVHNRDQPPPALAHPVRLYSNPALMDILQACGVGEVLEVNSYHHQGVPNRQQLPGALQVLAEAPDGVVEAFLWQPEESATPRALAVQWHPELLFEADPRHLWPFRWLVEAAQTGG